MPVYMTPFATDLLEARRLSEPGAPKLPLRKFGAGQVAELGPFTVEGINVAHSIPESLALAIRTPAGTVIHTGDWKIDETPVSGLPTDGARLKALGDEGVLALVCDSTNVLREGISPSETEVRGNLTRLIHEAKGRVAVTTVASNVGRIRSVAEAAAEVGREVVLVGRALDRVAQVAAENGLFEGLPPFRSAERYGQLKREKCVVILTGSQGEPRAALARVAEGEHPDVELSPGDRVIFSSRTIPGNEKVVGRIINSLAKAGIEIVTDREELVHVSGHPRREELRRMYEWVRPAIAIPAHGEALHLTRHAAFAKSMGVKQVVRPFNGDLVQLAPGPAAIIDEVPAGRLVRDGALIVEEGRSGMPDRRKLGFAGAVSVAVALDERGQFAADPEIVAFGLPVLDDEGIPFEETLREIVDNTFRSVPKGKRRDAEAVRIALERALRAEIGSIWGKKPLVRALVLEV